eukprot:CAMPEP_0171172118 /NCGR_PEP_ID=MMETSP0790-20130122/9560_1 /TAXON_ID=2925 /ORGANISM="Alexandrium catenella, Strain OF101" /LENGTH=1133 /DNA_ID=CAMNT_0011636977 /DNA_START=158 /DNA_END=3559 /DNA_ORIENTATION=+
MVQGAMRLRSEPGAMEEMKQAIEKMSPFVMGSDTVAVHWPSKDHPSENGPWGEDKLRGVSVKGFSKNGFTGGAFMTGGTDFESKHHTHAIYGAGYDGLKDKAPLPTRGGFIGAAQVTPGSMDIVNAVPGKNGGLDYGKYSARMTSGHVSSEVFDDWLDKTRGGKAGGSEKKNMARDEQQANAKKEKVVDDILQGLGKVAQDEIAKQQVKQHKGAEETQKAVKAVGDWFKNAGSTAATKKAQTEADGKKATSNIMETLNGALSKAAEAGKKQEAEAAAMKKYAEEEAAQKRADEEAVAKKAAEEQARKKAEEEAKAKAALEQAAKAAEEQARKKAEEEAKAKAALEQAAKAAEEQARKQAEGEAKALAALDKAKKDYEAKRLQEAQGKAQRDAAAAKAFGDWFKNAASSAKAAQVAQAAQPGAAEKKKAFEDLIRGVAAKKKDDAKKVRDFFQKIGQAQAAQAPHNHDGMLKHFSQAAEAAMSSPGSNLPALIEVGTEGSESSQDGEVAVDSDTEVVLAQDAEALHHESVQSSNEAVRRIAAAKEKLQKAKAALEKGKKRTEILFQENQTAAEKREHAEERKEHYAAKGVSFRLEQEMVEGLKGKHHTFDKAAYMERVKKGNLSRYGLWTSSDEKQHFGEKTWDILSNHIFGLDKLWKNINNATTMEKKARQYGKLAKQYAAQQAAAEEELLDLEAKMDQAEKDMDEADQEIADMSDLKAEQKAKQRAVRKQMAMEKAERLPRNQRRAARAAARAEAAAEAEEEAEEAETVEFEATEEAAEAAEEGKEAVEQTEEEPAEAANEEEPEEDAKLQDEAAFLQISATASESSQDGEVAQEQETEAEDAELKPQAQAEVDSESQHLMAVNTEHDATRRIAAAKEKLQKANQYLQFAQKRGRVLEEENATAVDKWEHAREKRDQYLAKGMSYRAKQAEVEGLRGKHVTFDKKAFAERMKNGNLSRYGLYTTSDEKQHFGEKTWDILSYHIFGLDKLMKNVHNASTMDKKARQYLKMEKMYAAQSAAAQEELLDIDAKVEQAEKEVDDARTELEEMHALKSEQKAFQREVRRKMAQEKRGKIPRTPRRSRKAVAEEEAAEEASGEEMEASGEEAEEAEADAAEKAEAASGEEQEAETQAM